MTTYTLTPRRLRTTVLAAALAVTSALAAPAALADTQVLSPDSLIAAQATPAVQIVVAQFSATITIPNWDINKAAWLAEIQTATTMDQVVNAVAASPAQYFVSSGAPRSKSASAGIQGSGFFVTPDGYIVTNAHVAAPTEASLKELLSQSVLTDIQKQDVQSIAAQSGGGTFTDAQLQKLAEAIVGLDQDQMSVTNLTKKYSVAVGVGIPGIGTDAKTIPAELTKAGEPTPGKDIAILKVEKSNLITLPLGDDTSLNTGDKLFVVGYPGDAEISQTSLTTPTLTTGSVSARKTLDNGLTVIQTDAAINHGNSGGPVLDSSGKVIGIATFGVTGSNGQTTAGLNFLYPVSLIKEMLTEANVQPSDGPTTQQWNAALKSYSKAYYSEALPEFQAVNQLIPSTPVVQDYISKTQAAITAGKDETPSTIAGLPKTGFFGLLGVLLLVLVGLVLFLVLRGRKGGTPAPAVAGAGYPGTPGVAYAPGPYPPTADGVAPVTAPPPPPAPVAQAPVPPPPAPPAPPAPAVVPPAPAVVAETAVIAGAAVAPPPAAPVAPPPPPVVAAPPPPAPVAPPPPAPAPPVAEAPAPPPAPAEAATPAAPRHFCSNCGTPHAEGARFCASCGQTLV